MINCPIIWFIDTGQRRVFRETRDTVGLDCSIVHEHLFAKRLPGKTKDPGVAGNFERACPRSSPFSLPMEADVAILFSALYVRRHGGNEFPNRYKRPITLMHVWLRWPLSGTCIDEITINTAAFSFDRQNAPLYLHDSFLNDTCATPWSIIVRNAWSKKRVTRIFEKFIRIFTVSRFWKVCWFDDDLEKFGNETFQFIFFTVQLYVCVEFFVCIVFFAIFFTLSTFVYVVLKRGGRVSFLCKWQPVETVYLSLGESHGARLIHLLARQHAKRDTSSHSKIRLR